MPLSLYVSVECSLPFQAKILLKPVGHMKLSAPWVCSSIYPIAYKLCSWETGETRRANSLSFGLLLFSWQWPHRAQPWGFWGWNWAQLGFSDVRQTQRSRGEMPRVPLLCWCWYPRRLPTQQGLGHCPSFPSSNPKHKITLWIFDLGRIGHSWI